VDRGVEEEVSGGGESAGSKFFVEIVGSWQLRYRQRPTVNDTTSNRF
jgi:hypothetical protein